MVKDTVTVKCEPGKE